MGTRKAISTKTRFEVFKRDSFKCQYCGAAAPEAVLHIDHINPVAKGGDNHITNLITSCAACNGGKGARKLDDHSEVAKQKAMLDELSVRREQLEMMMNWREGLKSIKSDELNRVQRYIIDSFGGEYTLNETGNNKVKMWLRKYSLKEILDAVDVCTGQYLSDKNGVITSETWNKAFEYIPRVIYGKRLEKDNPSRAEAMRARGRLRKLFNHINEWEALNLIEGMINAGLDSDDVLRFATQHRHWSHFRSGAESFLKDVSDGV